MSVSEHASLVNSQVHQDLEAPTTVYQPSYHGLRQPFYNQQETGNASNFANNYQKDYYKSINTGKKQSKKIVLTVLGTILAVGGLAGAGFGIYSCTRNKSLLEQKEETAEKKGDTRRKLVVKGAMADGRDNESVIDYLNSEMENWNSMTGKEIFRPIAKSGEEDQGTGAATSNNTINTDAKTTSAENNSSNAAQSPVVINWSVPSAASTNTSCCCGSSCCSGCGYCMLGYCASNLLCAIMNASYFGYVTDCVCCKENEAMERVMWKGSSCSLCWSGFGAGCLGNFLTCNAFSIIQCDVMCGGDCCECCYNSSCGPCGEFFRGARSTFRTVHDMKKQKSDALKPWSEPSKREADMQMMREIEQMKKMESMNAPFSRRGF